MTTRKINNMNSIFKCARSEVTHVDILGNVDTTLDILKIVTNYNNVSSVSDSIKSDIRDVASRINFRVDFKTNTKRKNRFLAQKRRLIK